MNHPPPPILEVTAAKPALAGFLVSAVTLVTSINIKSTSINGMLFMAKSILGKYLHEAPPTVTFKSGEIKPRVRVYACMGAYARKVRHIIVTNVTVRCMGNDVLNTLHLRT